jgi:hypothetical protein
VVLLPVMVLMLTDAQTVTRQEASEEFEGQRIFSKCDFLISIIGSYHSLLFVCFGQVGMLRFLRGRSTAFVRGVLQNGLSSYTKDIKRSPQN